MKNRDLIILLAGAAVGAGLVWLFTSKDGKEALGKMKDKADKLKDDLAKTLEELLSEEEEA